MDWHVTDKLNISHCSFYEWSQQMSLPIIFSESVEEDTLSNRGDLLTVLGRGTTWGPDVVLLLQAFHVCAWSNKRGCRNMYFKCLWISPIIQQLNWTACKHLWGCNNKLWFKSCCLFSAAISWLLRILFSYLFGLFYSNFAAVCFFFWFGLVLSKHFTINYGQRSNFGLASASGFTPRL